METNNTNFSLTNDEIEEISDFARAINPFKQKNKNAKVKTPIFSPRFIYAMCKKLDGFPNIEGSKIAWAMRVRKGYGRCENEYFPHDNKLSHEEYIKIPDDYRIYRNAHNFRISFYHKVYSVNDIKRAMKYCSAIVYISIKIYKDFYFPEEGRIKLPKKTDEKKGVHSIPIIGLKKDSFIIVNSWGKNWGDNGIGYLPFKYLKENVIECFASIDEVMFKNLLEKETKYTIKVKDKLYTMYYCAVKSCVLGQSNNWILELYNDDNKIVGWVFYRINELKEVIVNELFVLPEYRRMGLGKKLIETIEEWTINSSLEKIKFVIPNHDVIKSRKNDVESFFKSFEYDIDWQNPINKCYIASKYFDEDISFI